VITIARLLRAGALKVLLSRYYGTILDTVIRVRWRSRDKYLIQCYFFWKDTSRFFLVLTVEVILTPVVVVVVVVVIVVVVAGRRLSQRG
jgi:hypothetical protein